MTSLGTQREASPAQAVFKWEGPSCDQESGRDREVPLNVPSWTMVSGSTAESSPYSLPRICAHCRCESSGRKGILDPSRTHRLEKATRVWGVLRVLPSPTAPLVSPPS